MQKQTMQGLCFYHYLFLQHKLNTLWSKVLLNLSCEERLREAPGSPRCSFVVPEGTDKQERKKPFTQTDSDKVE